MKSVLILIFFRIRIKNVSLEYIYFYIDRVVKCDFYQFLVEEGGFMKIKVFEVYKNYCVFCYLKGK